jgi:hypothetical protein
VAGAVQNVVRRFHRMGGCWSRINHGLHKISNASQSKNFPNVPQTPDRNFSVANFADEKGHDFAAFGKH